MAWQTIRVANPRARRSYSTHEGYGLIPFSSLSSKQKKDVSRSWERKVKRRRRLPVKKYKLRIGNARNPDFLTDAIAGQIASSVASKVGGLFTTRKRKAKPRKRKRVAAKRQNARARKPKSRKASSWLSYDYPAGGKQGPVSKSILRKSKRHRKKTKKGFFASLTNPARRTTMAKARNRRRTRLGRDSKGRFLKAGRKRRRNSVRRRRITRAAPRRRRSNKVRVITKWRTRNKVVKMANKRRRRKGVRRRSRRNVAAPAPRRRRNRSRVAAAANPRRRRRRTVRRSRRRNTARRRNAGLGGLIGKVNLFQVAEVAGGVFFGDKLTGIVSTKIAGMLGITDSAMIGFVKVGVGIVGAGLVWRFRPALGLGVAVGATNSLLNQYVFNPLWGYASPYLPVAGLGEFQQQQWKLDPWVGGGGNGGAAVAGVSGAMMGKPGKGL